MNRAFYHPTMTRKRTDDLQMLIGLDDKKLKKSSSLRELLGKSINRDLPSSLMSPSFTLPLAQEGKLLASSLQSDKFRSRLSNVEKLLRDESQLRFWLKLLDAKFVTTPLDELELA